MTERLTRSSETDIHYEFTVEDSQVYTQPWTAELSFYPQTKIYEYACHEGNYGLRHMLAGARVQERDND